ncbi:MAG: AlpA family phage regulatory protein [Gammaproteobacteria bacterium]|nr:AlpA family phage regulatory protein [Gammaproteobacteria bacterium]
MDLDGLVLVRRPWERRGISRSTLYAEIAAGLFPRPVKPSPRIAAWPRGEIDAITRAHIAGASVADVRAVVARIYAARAALAAGGDSPRAA